MSTLIPTGCDRPISTETLQKLDRCLDLVRGLVGILWDEDLSLAEGLDDFFRHLAVSKDLPNLLQTKIFAIDLSVPGGMKEKD